MRTMNYQNIITIEPGKRGGRPCIRRMRITVSDVLGWLADGMTHQKIIDDYPELTEEDIRACLAYAAEKERNARVASPERMDVPSEPVWAVSPKKVEAVIKRLIEVGRPRKVFLFGSYVRGQLHRDSDVDVLVVAGDGVENTRKESVRLRSAVSDILMPMDILVVRENVFEKLKDKVGLIYREAVRHGRLVYDARAAA